MTTERSGMSLETVRDWHRKEQDENARIADLQYHQSASHAMYQSIADHHGAMADAIDAYLSRDAVVADFPMGAIENGRVFADRVENTDLSCIAGDLHLCVDRHEFRRCFEHLANWALTESFADRHAAVPDELHFYMTYTASETEAYKIGDKGLMIDVHHEYAKGWNACRKAMLAQRDGG